MTVRWHSHKSLSGRSEHVLFVGPWEWRVNDLKDFIDHDVEVLFGGKVRWRAVGLGLGGGAPDHAGTAMTVTLRQAKARCEDAALRLLGACARVLEKKVVPA